MKQFNKNILTLPPLKRFLDNDKFKIKYTSDNLGDVDILTEVTNNREILFDSTEGEYMNTPGLSKLLNYKKLKDLEKGAEILVRHAKAGNKIVCVCDYDADGVTSGALNFLALSDFIAPESTIVVIVNNREFGNGVNEEMGRRIMKEHEKSPVHLVITSDHGSNIGDDARYKMFKENGMEVIVTDHHLVPTPLMYPDAFINPQQSDCPYSPNISGTVVLFCLLEEARRVLDLPDDHMKSLYPLLAITTISDMMPMNHGINRRIVSEGLKELENMKYPAYKAMKSAFDADKELTVMNLSFKLNPLLNAAGRIDDATKAFTFLTAGTTMTAVAAMKELSSINAKRRRIQNKLVGTANDIAMSTPDSKSLFITLPNAAEGVQGIIAGNVGEAFNKPTLCAVDNGEFFVASGRAILPNLSIKDLMDRMHQKDPKLLGRYGGHAGAAGCSVYADKIKLAKDLLEEATKDVLGEIDIRMTYEVDADLSDKDISFEVLEEIEKLGPYGYKYRDPVFIGTFSLIDIKPIPSVKGLNRITFRLPNGYTIGGMYKEFDLEPIKKAVNTRVVLIYSMNRNYFLGKETISLTVHKILHKYLEI